VAPLSRPLADLLARALPRDQRFDAVVPVPLHWWRRWRRGFNQSELLAREISRRTGAPIAGALRRIRATSAQAGLTHGARRRNVAGAFRARGASQTVAGKNVLLIDDVMTTGSTGAACALALKRAGARRVTLLTVARVDRRLDHVKRDYAKGAEE
jgi:ComF family protein